VGADSWCSSRARTCLLLTRNQLWVSLEKSRRLKMFWETGTADSHVCGNGGQNFKKKRRPCSGTAYATRLFQMVKHVLSLQLFFLGSSMNASKSMVNTYKITIHYYKRIPSKKSCLWLMLVQTLPDSPELQISQVQLPLDTLLHLILDVIWWLL
jgi:hypothetical protein